MEFKGTKGTWSYCPSEISKHRNFAVLVEGTGSMIADIYLKTNWDEDTGLTKLPEESEANAKLIVAAPFMLNTLIGQLEIAESCLKSHKDSISDKIFWEGQIKRLKTAIEQALL